MKPRYTIAVTGLNNTDNPGPGVPVIRSLREAESFDVRIIGLAYENLEPGIYMEGIADKVYRIPYPSGGTDVLTKRILEISEKEDIHLVIPNFDAELFSFIKSEDLLAEHGIKTYLPTLKQFEERHKARLEEFGKKYGIKVPKGRNISNFSDIKKIAAAFEYPVLVKGKYYDAYLAYNEAQVIEHFNKISAKWGLPVIVQEFIRGTEVNVVALGDGKGTTIGAVPMRKQYITDKGKAWGGISLSDEKMLKITHDLIRNTQWRGGMELEMIKTHDEQYYLIEINPRIPAWVYLATAAGQNLPEALVNLAFGKEVIPFESFEHGKMFIRYSYDLVGDIAQFEQLSITGEL